MNSPSDLMQRVLSTLCEDREQAAARPPLAPEEYPKFVPAAVWGEDLPVLTVGLCGHSMVRRVRREQLAYIHAMHGEWARLACGACMPKFAASIALHAAELLMHGWVPDLAAADRWGSCNPFDPGALRYNTIGALMRARLDLHGVRSEASGDFPQQMVLNMLSQLAVPGPLWNGLDPVTRYWVWESQTGRLFTEVVGNLRAAATLLRQMSEEPPCAPVSTPEP